MARRALFAAIPLRAVGDSNLTDGDIRVLASIAAFDRLSHSTGKGQGAWASHRLMSGWIDRNYSNFSAAVNKLIKAGYLVREQRETDKRQHTYRIVYTDDDCLPKAEDFVRPEANYIREIVCPDTGEVREVVCPDPQSTDGNLDENFPEYIPQSGERYSVETGERNSAKRRDVAVARRPGGILCQLPANINDLPMGARVSKVEAAFDALGRDPYAMPDEELTKIKGWLDWVFDNHADEAFGQQAVRLLGEMDI
jgi:DNA-binding MarR family transcriptional regulator